MRPRLIAVVGILVLVGMLAAPSLAHDDDHDEMPAHMARQMEDFQAVQSRAPGHSNAPRSFAPCRQGLAAGVFPCDGVDLMSWLDREALGVSFVNDIWGWTDPQTRKDYALLGATEGTVFVDISDPRRPVVLGILPAHTLDPDRPFWRDIKVHADHAFVVSEQTGHGMQVFDLTGLRDWDGGYETFDETAHYDGFSTAHNIAINTDSGYAYAVGTDTFDGGLHIVDVSEPTDPVFAGSFDEHGYIHDTQCVIYDGPDADYRGREICFNSNADGPAFTPDIVNALSIVDVTDKSSPDALSRTTYANDGYSHQGWLTPDQAYFLHGDELDELVHGLGTTTRVWDVGGLEQEQVEVIGVFENDTDAIDHNLYTQGRYAYASNYTAGLRVYDIGNVADGELAEAAFFDVYPEHDDPIFLGTWSNYPYFHQKGIVAVSSIDRGLFVLQPRVGRAGN